MNINKCLRRLPIRFNQLLNQLHKIYTYLHIFVHYANSKMLLFHFTQKNKEDRFLSFLPMSYKQRRQLFNKMNNKQGCFFLNKWVTNKRDYSQPSWGVHKQWDQGRQPRVEAVVGQQGVFEFVLTNNMLWNQ